MSALLDARDLAKSFGGLKAADGVSLSVDEGETLGIIGPNGAGKTTLFNLLSGEIKADAGEVFLAGKNITRAAVHERANAGLVRTYQVPRPFAGMTVRDNIRVSMTPDNLRQMITEGADQQAETAVAESVGFRREQLEQYPSQLAMGDLRKLELARTLAMNPKVLLLDEVFAGLTFGEIEQISALLAEKKRRQGITYVIVSHDLKSLAPLVDRVAVIHFGRVLTAGSFADVVGDKAVQDAYLGTVGTADSGVTDTNPGAGS